MARKKAVFSLFLLTLLFFITPLDSLAQDENPASKPTFQELMAKRDALRAEQGALGVQWQANQDRMAEMESRYNFLQTEIESKQVELQNLEFELARLSEGYKAAGPSLDARVADFNTRKATLNDEVIGFNRACGRTFSEAEEAAYNACQARRSLLKSQENTLNREIKQYNTELEAFTKPLEAAKRDYIGLRDQFLALTNESQNLIRERTSLQQENFGLVDQGRRLGAEIEQTERLAVKAMAGEDFPCGKGENRPGENLANCLPPGPGASPGQSSRSATALSPKPGGDYFDALSAPRTRADYILDALEYGNGDWDSSLQYLNDLTIARPEDRAAAEAKNYLEGLAADLAGGGG